MTVQFTKEQGKPAMMTTDAVRKREGSASANPITRTQ
ncbi:hypothetical protein A2U01_0083184, partial [Trifolium medium]|nr:hypothetical protein [Trifolium medium]